MRGFTNRALVLLSDDLEYADSSSVHKYDYQAAIKNLIHYLSDMGVTHDCFVTDRLATSMNMRHPQWVATGTPEDMFFMRSYCGVPDYPAKELDGAIIERLRTKFVIERGLAPAERFKVVAKRVRQAEKELINSYAFIVVFGKTFNVKSKPGDGRAILRINEKRFYTSLELSGTEVPINDFLQIPYANQCISEWGKYSGRH